MSTRANNTAEPTENVPVTKMLLIGCEPTSGAFLEQTVSLQVGNHDEWLIVCIPPRAWARTERMRQYEQNIRLALRSGARVIRLDDMNMVHAISDLMTKYQVKRLLYSNFMLPILPGFTTRKGLISRLKKLHPGMETVKKTMKNSVKSSSPENIEVSAKPKEYLLAAIAVTITAAICFPIKHLIGYQTVGLILLILTAILSLFLGRGAVFLTAILNFVIWNFLFIPPILTFHIANIHDIILLFAYLAVALSGGSLITRLRKNQAALELSRQNITLLYSLLESLNNANSIRDVVSKVRMQLERNFNADAIVYLKEKSGLLLEKRSFGNAEFFSESEFDYAGRVFSLKESETTRQFGDKQNVQYFPLVAQSGALGVIGIVTDAGHSIVNERLIFLKSFITQISSALEREISIDKAKESQVYQESQKLFQTVLNSVSHELRTPVAIISSAVSNLMDEKIASDHTNRTKICHELESSAVRLNQLVENIIDMSKIDSGYLSLDLQSYDVAELIGVVINHMKDELAGHDVTINIPDPLPAVLIDINWMKQAIVNILHNAVNYASIGTEIVVTASNNGTFDQICISDQGPGVPASSIEHLFDKFYRVPGSKSGGTGLGLTIAKALIEAHHGTISIANNPSRGLTVTIQLPISPADGK
ncbi:MAG TPA: ATP-binding protein [Bacteroidales bacterium]|nr:ATP-binding protein [Bacteroidales bacterium]